MAGINLVTTGRYCTAKPFRRLWGAGWMAAVLWLVSLTLSPAAIAAEEDGSGDKEIQLQTRPNEDRVIESRVKGILTEMEALQKVEVSAAGGVVQLSGEAPNEAAAEKAIALVNRIEGVIAVEDSIERTLDLTENVAPVLESVRSTARRWIRALPLFLAALAVFVVVVFLAHQLARRQVLWSRLTPNPFVAQLAAQVVRLAGIVLGLVLALNLLGATALMGTILGSAGVAGLALSFGVKDVIENYVASIMLSIRQPFRAQDHVVIDSFEGLVIRLTSRSTVLMTLDGNHLRIPNALVYKAPILNYTRNPQRRFDFVLGIDADDDPADAMSVGLEAISALEWILDDPAPYAIIDSVGDSNIVVTFMAWIDQSEADFGKARSLAIRAAKNAVEAHGFTLPEPIYRLRFDDGNSPVNAGRLIDRLRPRQDGDRHAAADPPDTPVELPTEVELASHEHADVRPETHLSDQVRKERVADAEEDLLDVKRPVE
jgi:small-conductance mechanosensitive channel